MKTLLVIFEEIFKGLVIGILPFILFIVITSRSSVLGGIRSFVVLTGSMEPNISVGSVIFTHPFQLYKINDVIAFENEGKNVTHRIVDTEIKEGKTYYKTMGDANAVSDQELVTQSSVLGNVFFTIPYIGRVVFFIKTIPGYLTVIILPAALFIAFELVEIYKELSKNTDKKLIQKIQTV